MTLNLPTGMTLSLPSLLSYSNGTLTVPDQTSVTANEATALTNVTVSLLDGGSIVMPNLVTFDDSSVSVTPERTFQTGGLTSANDASLRTSYGAVWGVSTGDFAASGYSSTGVYRQYSSSHDHGQTYSHLLLESLGTDAGGQASVLDLSSLQGVNAGFNDGDDDRNIQQIKALAGGRIDLSGVQVVTGPYRNSNDRLDFIAEGGGEIDLTGLQEVKSARSGYVRFAYDTGTLSLPSLTKADRMTVEMGAGSTLDVGALETASNMTVTLGAGSQMTAASLKWGSNMTLNLPTGMTLSLPSLLSYSGGTLTVPDQTSVTANEATTLTGVTVSLSDGGSIVMPNLVTFDNSSVSVTPERTFQTGGLTSANNALLSTWYGAVWGVSTGDFAASDYSSTEIYRQYSSYHDHGQTYTHLLLQSFGTDGEGQESVLDLSSLQGVNAGFNDGDDDRNIHQIKALAGGRIDLSGVKLVTGPYRNSNDRLDFIAEGGGEIDLTGLEEVKSARSGYVRFVYDGASLLLPSLTKANRMTVELTGVGLDVDMSSLQEVTDATVTSGAGTNMSLASLRQTSNASVTLGSNSSLTIGGGAEVTSTSFTLGEQSHFEVTGMWTFTDSTLNLTAPQHLDLGTLVDATRSNFWLTGSGTMDLSGMTTFNVNHTNHGGHLTLLSADGPSAEINLSNVVTFNGAGWGNSGAWKYTVAASNGGVIDLSGVKTIHGASSSSGGGDDLLVFEANSGGQIQFGEAVQVTGRTRFELGSGGTLHIKDLAAMDHGEFYLNDMSTVLDVEQNLYLAAGGKLVAAPLSRINVGKSLVIGSTSEADVDLDQAIVHLVGGGMRYFELASEDLGVPSDVMEGNFGIGQLVVGSPDTPTTVEFLDAFDNGNRGGGNEALYLCGLGSNLDGLILHEGSALILDHLDAYAWMDGDWVYLNTWLEDGMAPTTITLGGYIMEFDSAAQSVTSRGVVPEPSSLVLVILGVLSLLFWRKR